MFRKPILTRAISGIHHSQEVAPLPRTEPSLPIAIAADQEGFPPYLHVRCALPIGGFRLRALGQDPSLFELHATELWRGKKEWSAVRRTDRRKILDGAYGCLAGYRPVNPNLPLRLLGVVLDRDGTAWEDRAYGLVAKKFDDYVYRMSTKSAVRQRGLIIHDRSSVEQRLQSWTAQWRAATSPLGRLRNFADVPLFADSKATRALQAADLVAYALYRYYSNSYDDRFTRRLWSMFDADQGRMHGLFHQCRDHKSCPCPACKNRTTGPY